MNYLHNGVSSFKSVDEITKHDLKKAIEQYLAVCSVLFFWCTQWLLNTF